MSKGFSLVEVLLAAAVFGLIVTGLIGGLIYGQQSTATAGMQSRATFLADEGLEATRNLRDGNFSNLANGTFGLTTTGNQWHLSGSSDTTDNFTRNIAISTVDANTKQIVSTVNWTQNAQRAGSVSTTTYLCNWTQATTIPNCAAYCTTLTYTSGICRQAASQCTRNGEVPESGGNIYCTAPGAKFCCCTP